MIFTNCGGESRKEVGLARERKLGYLALPGSPVTAIDAVDRPGVRIGVSQGSTSQGTLTAQFKQASVAPAPSLQAAREMLKGQQLDAFATPLLILLRSLVAGELAGFVAPPAWSYPGVVASMIAHKREQPQIALGVPRAQLVKAEVPKADIAVVILQDRKSVV